MNLSIGEIVAADIKRSGLSVTYVAQQMGMSRKGLSDILKRDDMSLSQLASLSEILNKDYFDLYKSKHQQETGIKLPSAVAEDKNEYVPTNEPKMSFTLNILGGFDTLKKEIPELLEVIKNETEARGLQLG
ncbi:helix-turn-helix transcriptional regulator [Parapedobacter lycopersici]|uniref:helix-turn-helix transcriptional regulator n=1 Tax=Parapedobacter lycopersici TaxID=1864939 RepID=UPI00334019E2